MLACRHCHAEKRLKARGLCVPCYHDRSIRQQYPTPKASARRDYTSRELDLIELRRSQRVPLKQIAAELGRSYHSVSEACGRNGLRAYTRDPARTEAVQRMARPGLLDTEMARTLRCSVSRIATIRKALGIPRGVSAAEAGRRGFACSALRHGHPKASAWDMNRLATVREGWPAGCTRAYAAVLATLQQGPLTAKEVAARTRPAIATATAAKLLTRMKHWGWVVRGRRSGGAKWSLSPDVAECRGQALARQQG
jgi:hypothetical protein